MQTGFSKTDLLVSNNFNKKERKKESKIWTYDFKKNV